MAQSVDFLFGVNAAGPSHSLSSSVRPGRHSVLHWATILFSMLNYSKNRTSCFDGTKKITQFDDLCYPIRRLTREL